MYRFGLRFACWAYSAAMCWRNLAFDRGWRRIERASAPVISVGNLTTGGAGKTPCVEYVAKYLRSRDVCVVILSRGYGSTGRNDEAMMLEECLPDVPHLQGPDRVALAQTAIEELEAELLLLDDGMQHRRLHRDLDLALVDVTNPWGYGSVLPRGLLREPRAGLRRAAFVILTRCDQAPSATVAEIENQVRQLAPDAVVLQSVHRPAGWLHGGDTRPVDDMKGKSVGAFCGIGSPLAFRTTLQQLGLNIVGWREFPDHHPYDRNDVESLHDWAESMNVDAIVTTHKDLVKIRLKSMGSVPLKALRVEFQILQGEDQLQSRIGTLIDR
jgi:tetraacyldisaccharide 4'-kinase